MDIFICLLGTTGALLLLSAYYLLIIGQIRATSGHYIMLNIVGALFTTIAVHCGKSAPIFPTLLAWVCISLYGLYKHHLASPE